MKHLLAILLLAAYFTTAALTEDVTGKCPLATKLFNSKSSKDETELITQSTMCPKVKNSCCDEDTFKSMNVWWDNSGDMSMNRLWLEKIQRIYKEMRLMNTIYFPKVFDYVRKYQTFMDPNHECLENAKFIQQVWDSKAFEQMFYVFPHSVEKCWQYTINFTRGLACSVCDITSTYHYSTNLFGISNEECYRFTESCSEHMQVFHTFFVYTKWMSGMASCKSKGKIMSKEESPYFNNRYLLRLTSCMQNPKGSHCRALCVDNMPWNGITSMELKLFGNLQVFLNNIKTVFKDQRYTKQSDTIITTWKTKQDEVIETNFKKVGVRATGFNITDYFDPENSGLSLERLGFVDLKEWVKQQNAIDYAAGILRISLWVVVGGLLMVDGGW